MAVAQECVKQGFHALHRCVRASMCTCTWSLNASNAE